MPWTPVRKEGVGAVRKGGRKGVKDWREGEGGKEGKGGLIGREKDVAIPHQNFFYLVLWVQGLQNV
jgi:hypothetical protein